MRRKGGGGPQGRERTLGPGMPHTQSPPNRTPELGFPVELVVPTQRSEDDGPRWVTWRRKDGAPGVCSSGGRA